MSRLVGHVSTHVAEFTVQPLHNHHHLHTMATGKEQLPTLTGHKFKTRKRDEKVKYDSTAFSEQVP